MSQRIYKYPLALTDTQSIVLPEGAEVLHVGMQDDGLMLWALVDADRTGVHRTFQVAGTGHSVSLPGGRLVYIGTVLAPLGLVWHVFERVSVEM